MKVAVWYRDRCACDDVLRIDRGAAAAYYKEPLGNAKNLSDNTRHERERRRVNQECKKDFFREKSFFPYIVYMEMRSRLIIVSTRFD